MKNSYLHLREFPVTNGSGTCRVLRNFQKTEHLTLRDNQIFQKTLLPRILVPLDFPPGISWSFSGKFHIKLDSNFKKFLVNLYSGRLHAAQVYVCKKIELKLNRTLWFTAQSCTPGGILQFQYTVIKKHKSRFVTVNACSVELLFLLILRTPSCKLPSGQKIFLFLTLQFRLFDLNTRTNSQ